MFDPSKVSSRKWSKFMQLALALYYAKRGYAVCREVGLPFEYTDIRTGTKGFCGTKLRADFVAVNKKKEVIIVETKSSKSDFETDKKWTNYLKCCTKFYFCVAPEMLDYMKEKLEGYPQVGIICVEKKEQSHIYDLVYFPKRAKKLESDPPIELILWQMAVRGSGIGYDLSVFKTSIWGSSEKERAETFANLFEEKE